MEFPCILTHLFLLCIGVLCLQMDKLCLIEQYLIRLNQTWFCWICQSLCQRVEGDSLSVFMYVYITATFPKWTIFSFSGIHLHTLTPWLIPCCAFSCLNFTLKYNKKYYLLSNHVWYRWTIRWKCINYIPSSSASVLVFWSVSYFPSDTSVCPPWPFDLRIPHPDYLGTSSVVSFHVFSLCISASSEGIQS